MLQIQNFELVPFQKDYKISSLRGELGVNGGLVDIRFELTGQLEGLEWPELTPAHDRQYGLWEHTCLEFFIGSVTSKSYHEVNLSPSGHWNCFSFTDVREGMRESETLTLSSLESSRTDTNAILRATLGLKQHRPDSLRIGISAVIELSSKLHYYSLAHGESPDFHARQHHTLVYPRTTSE